MSATLNVTSSFTLGEYYNFGDSEQIKILKWIETFFDKLGRGLTLKKQL